MWWLTVQQIGQRVKQSQPKSSRPVAELLWPWEMSVDENHLIT
jgi:hypothetical protein